MKLLHSLRRIHKDNNGLCSDLTLHKKEEDLGSEPKGTKSIFAFVDSYLRIDFRKSEANCMVAKVSSSVQYFFRWILFIWKLFLSFLGLKKMLRWVPSCFLETQEVYVWICRREKKKKKNKHTHREKRGWTHLLLTKFIFLGPKLVPVLLGILLLSSLES